VKKRRRGEPKINPQRKRRGRAIESLQSVCKHRKKKQGWGDAVKRKGNGRKTRFSLKLGDQ